MARSRLLLALVGVLLVVGVRVGASSQPPVFPLVALQQGVTPRTYDGVRLFLVRQGTLQLAAFRVVAPSGGRLAYCPKENVFVSFDRKDLFDADGRWVAGPSERDMDRVPIRVDERGAVHLEPSTVLRASGRSAGRVSGEVGLRYDRFAHPRTGEDPIPFCEGAVR